MEQSRLQWTLQRCTERLSPGLLDQYTTGEMCGSYTACWTTFRRTLACIRSKAGTQRVSFKQYRSAWVTVYTDSVVTSCRSTNNGVQ
jgi:hypothetical protein